ncbi:trypsin CFT-1-like [Leptidea sinapis]|uniref:trypsin CFT-1-like n=1 Tax=Leptidea sinapis TaxID=189913 RepID=UPI002126F8C1|nr:trypsin CFT-1-like [Leptidea sinapis]
MIAKTVAFVICCAVASASPQGRIAGGEAAEVESHPYMTALVYYYPRPDIYIQRCVGPLISSWHVLTTAYCFNGATLENFQVRAGSTKSMEGGSVTTIVEVIEHPDYVLNPRENDIAVVLLATPFSVSDVTYPLPLPPQNLYLAEGTAGVVTGWGFDGEDGDQLDSLNTVTLRTVSLDTCEKAYADVSDVAIKDTVLCASEENKGTCFGDSGAPLTTYIYSQKALIGISSVYKDCGSAEYPDVFTRVDRFTDWILEVAVVPSKSSGYASPQLAV